MANHSHSHPLNYQCQLVKVSPMNQSSFVSLDTSALLSSLFLSATPMNQPVLWVLTLELCSPLSLCQWPSVLPICLPPPIRKGWIASLNRLAKPPMPQHYQPCDTSNLICLPSPAVTKCHCQEHWTLPLCQLLVTELLIVNGLLFLFCGR